MILFFQKKKHYSIFFFFFSFFKINRAQNTHSNINNSKTQLPSLSSAITTLSPVSPYTSNYLPTSSSNPINSPNSTTSSKTSITSSPPSPTTNSLNKSNHPFRLAYSNQYDPPWGSRSTSSTTSSQENLPITSPLSTSISNLSPFSRDKKSPSNNNPTDEDDSNVNSIYKKNPSIFSFVKHPRPYKKRRRLSENETKILLEQFNKNPMPSARTRAKLAALVPGMTERTVQIWFQNRRAKMRLTGQKPNFSRSDSDSALSSEGSDNEQGSQDESDLMTSQESPQLVLNHHLHPQQQLQQQQQQSYHVNINEKKNEMPLSLILQAIPEFEAKEKEKIGNKKPSNAMSINFLLD